MLVVASWRAVNESTVEDVQTGKEGEECDKFDRDTPMLSVSASDFIYVYACMHSVYTGMG